LLAFNDDSRPRWLLVAGLLSGLALANHHLIALLFLVPAAVNVYARKTGRPAAKHAALTAMLGLLGLAAFLYLPVRSQAHPEVNWGAPHNAERFAWTISAKAFQKTATAEQTSSGTEDAVQVTVAIAQAVTIPIALLALAAFYLGIRRRGRRRMVMTLAAIAVAGGAGRVLLGFDPETADHHAYLLPAIAAVALLALSGLASLSETLATARPGHRRAPAFAAIALLLLVPIQLFASHDQARLDGDYGADTLARWELEELPPRTLLLPAYFQTSFRLWALRSVEQSRPDVAILDRSFLTYPGHPEEARLRYPELSSLVDAPLRAGEITPVELLRELARTRPVVMQLHPNVDDAALPWLVPLGPFAMFSANEPTTAERDQGEHIDQTARAELAAGLGEPGEGPTQTKLALLWHDFVRLDFYCSRGRRPAAADALASAWKLFPHDVTLIEIASACGLEVPR
jgi:hypothetical protein